MLPNFQLPFRDSDSFTIGDKGAIVRFQLPFRDSLTAQMINSRYLIFQLPFRDSVTILFVVFLTFIYFQLPFRDS